MKQITPKPDEFLTLLDAACDRELSAGQHAELETYLRDHPEARRVFIDHLRLRRQIRSWWRGKRSCRAGFDGLVAQGDEAEEAEDTSGSDAGPGGLARPYCASSLPGWGASGSGLNAVFNLATFSYAIAILIAGAGILAAWAWTSSAPPQTPEIARRVAGPTPQTAVSKPAVPVRATEKMGSAPGGRAAAVALPPASEVAPQSSVLFSIPTVAPGDEEARFEIADARRPGTPILRGKIKFWAEDGAEPTTLWSARVGPSTVEELMYRSLAPVGLRIEARMARDGSSPRALRRTDATLRGPTPAADRPSGMYFPPYLYTYAKSAAAPSKSGQPPRDAPGDGSKAAPAGAEYTSRVLFVLADVAPESAELWCSYLSQNRLSAVRLNGKALPAPQAVNVGADHWLSVFCTKEGFRHGAKIANILEIDAHDLSAGASAEKPPRFCLGLAGLWTPSAALPPEEKEVKP